MQTEVALRAALADQVWDALISDYHMPGFGAPGAFAVARECAPDVPFIIVSGTVGEDVAVQMMKAGVNDYILKGKLARLVPALEREIADATRRARMRRELERSEEMLVRAERMRALGEMASGVSHDLKNMLVNPLVLQLEVADRALKRGAVDKAHATVVDMRSVVMNGLALIERLRDFGRQSPEEAGASIDLDDLARQAVEIARARIGPANRRPPRLRLDATSPAAVRGSRPELLSALVNLIVNAIDALCDGGTITVRSGCDGLAPFVEVEDDGPGMAKAVADRVFEPFFTTKQNGTGIGLAMAYACARRHGAELTLATAPGQGARFRLAFPAAP